MDRVRLRAIPVIVSPNRIGHVGYVIWAIQVLAIPACWKEYLSAHAVWTLMIEEILSLGPIRVIGMRIAIIFDTVILVGYCGFRFQPTKTDITNGLVCSVGSIICSPGIISGKHLI